MSSILFSPRTCVKYSVHFHHHSFTPARALIPSYGLRNMGCHMIVSSALSMESGATSEVEGQQQGRWVRPARGGIHFPRDATFPPPYNLLQGDVTILISVSPMFSSSTTTTTTGEGAFLVPWQNSSHSLNVGFPGNSSKTSCFAWTLPAHEVSTLDDNNITAAKLV